MSKLSVWLHEVGDWAAALVSNAPPEQQTAIANISQSLKGAASVIEQSLPALAKLIVDTALASVGYGKYIPDLNGLIDAIIAELQSRKTTTAQVQPPTS
jgi:hypothetical protein